jgi:hypothetical protein
MSPFKMSKQNLLHYEAGFVLDKVDEAVIDAVRIIWFELEPRRRCNKFFVGSRTSQPSLVLVP